MVRARGGASDAVVVGSGESPSPSLSAVAVIVGPTPWEEPQLRTGTCPHRTERNSAAPRGSAWVRGCLAHGR